MHRGLGPSQRTMFLQIPDKKLYENTDKAATFSLVKGLLKNPYIADMCHFNASHVEKVSKFLGSSFFDCFITLSKPTQAGHDKHLSMHL